MCTQILVTPLLLPLGRTDVGLYTLLCPIIFMQMRIKSGEIRGHPFLLVLISNECYIVYIMYEAPLIPPYAGLHCDLEHKAKFALQHRELLIVTNSRHAFTLLQNKPVRTLGGIYFCKILSIIIKRIRAPAAASYSVKGKTNKKNLNRFNSPVCQRHPRVWP